MFAVLVFAKSSTTKKKSVGMVEAKYYINGNSFQNIINLLDFRITENKLIEALRELVKMRLLTPYLPNARFDNVIWVNIATDKGSMALRIQFPEQCMEYYKTYIGGVSGYCVDCGAEIIKKSNSQVRCETCAREKKKEKTRNSMRRIRSKTV